MSAEAALEISFDAYGGSEPSPEEHQKQFALIAGGVALHQMAEAAAPEEQPSAEDKKPLPFRGHAGSCYCMECQRHGFAPNDYSSFRNQGMFSTPGLWG